MRRTPQPSRLAPSKIPAHFVLQVEAGLRALEGDVPPPDGQTFFEAFRKPAEDFQITSSQLSELIKVQATLPRREAMLRVLASLLLPNDYDWNDTLRVCAGAWPEWGYAYSAAAKHSLERGDLWRARGLLDMANRRLPVGDRPLLRRLETLREKAKNAGEIKLEGVATHWLACHKFNASNFCKYADYARRTHNQELHEEALMQWLSVVGWDPDRWPITDDFLSLSSAGSLCMHVNYLHAQSGERHNYRRWNRAALAFLVKSIDKPNPSGDAKAYARIRIAETYSNLVRFPDPRMPDVEFDELVSDATRAAVDLTERFIRAGEQQDLLYAASRHLAGVYTGVARWTRLRGESASKTNAVIEKANVAYEAWFRYASSQSKARFVEEERQSFLLENLDYASAESALEECSLPAMTKAVAAFRRGLTSVAVEHLLSELRSGLRRLRRSTSAERSQRHLKPAIAQALGCGSLLSHYIQVAAKRGLSIAPTLRNSAEDALRSLLPDFIEATQRAIRRGDLAKARRLLAVAKRSASPGNPKLLHLATRIDLKEQRPPEEILHALTADTETASLILRNDYLRSVFLKALSRCAKSFLDPQIIWSMVKVIRPAGDESHDVPADYDPVALTHVLLWELRAGRLEGWPQRVLDAQRMCPRADALFRLPSRAYEIVPTEAPRLVQDLVASALESSMESERCSRNLRELPGEFFSQDEILPRLGSAVASRLRKDHVTETAAPLRLLVDGLCRGLISSWKTTTDLGSRVHKITAWISQWIPASHRGACWTQLLGSNRGKVEAALVEQYRDDVESLRASLLAEQLGVKERVDLLIEFVKGAMRSTGSREYTDDVASSVLRHCCRSALEYRPYRVDPHYWAKLEKLVNDEIVEHGTGPEATLVAELWLKIHAEIVRMFERRLLPLMAVRFHSLKNELVRGKETPPGWQERVRATTERTLEYLRLHRWPVLEAIDFREVLSSSAYRPRYSTAAEMGRPRLWPVRPDRPVMIYGDRALLVECVSELLRNAADANGPGACSWVYAEVGEETDEATLRISDDAGGCSDDVVRDLNAPYPGSTLRSWRSTGFGHLLCQRVAYLHGGRLRYSFSPMKDLGLVTELRIPLVKWSLPHGGSSQEWLPEGVE